MTVRIRLTQPRLRKIAGVQLRPGLQSLSSEDWAKVKAHPIGAANLDRGVLVEVETKGQESQGNLSANDLVEQMPEVFDVEALKKYAEDKRSTVAKAANEQLQKINDAANKE